MKDVLAEERLSQRLVERRSLRPPVDVEGVLFDYADIEYVRFPVEIDGLCLNLKMVGKGRLSSSMRKVLHCAVVLRLPTSLDMF